MVTLNAIPRKKTTGLHILAPRSRHMVRDTAGYLATLDLAMAIPCPMDLFTQHPILLSPCPRILPEPLPRERDNRFTRIALSRIDPMGILQPQEGATPGQDLLVGS